MDGDINIRKFLKISGFRSFPFRFSITVVGSGTRLGSSGLRVVHGRAGARHREVVLCVVRYEPPVFLECRSALSVWLYEIRHCPASKFVLFTVFQQRGFLTDGNLCACCNHVSSLLVAKVEFHRRHQLYGEIPWCS